MHCTTKFAAFNAVAAVLLLALLLMLCHPGVATAGIGTAEITRPVDTNSLIIKAAYVYGIAKSSMWFNYYELDFKEAGNPDSTYESILTDTIQHTTSSLLGKWITSSLDQGDYILRLRVFINYTSIPVATDTVPVHVTPDSGSGFRFVGPLGHFTGVANYFDHADNDKDLEIVYPSGGSIYLVHDDGTVETLDTVSGSRHYYSPAAVGNLDDGSVANDVVTILSVENHNDSAIWFINGQPGGREGIELDGEAGYSWEVEYAYSRPVLCDVDNDGVDDIFIMGRASGDLYYHNIEDATEDTALGAQDFVLADLDDDGIPSLYTCINMANQHVIHEYGYDSGWQLVDSIIPTDDGYGLATGNAQILSTCDIDDDAVDEVILVALCSDSIFHMWAYRDSSGVLVTVADWPRTTNIEYSASEGTYVSHPVFGDIDGNGVLECFIGAYDLYYGYVYAWRVDNGDPYIGNDGLFAQVPSYASVTQPLLTDIDGDGNIDVVISACNAQTCDNAGQRLVAWDADGELLPDFPIEISTSAYVDYMFVPTIDDFDRNGDLDLVLPYTSGLFFLYDFRNAVAKDITTPVAMYRYQQNFDSHGPSFGLYNDGFICGDVDSNQVVTSADVTYLQSYIFSGGPAPKPLESGDVNCLGAGTIDVADLVYLGNYVNTNGPAPCDCDSIYIKMLPAEICLEATYQNGYTTLGLSSSIDLGALEIQFEDNLGGSPINLTAEDIEMNRAYYDEACRYAFIDLDGGKQLAKGQYNIMRIPGRCTVVSAMACDVRGAEYAVNLKASDNLPKEYALYRNYPNPFNPATTINFDLPRSADVKIEVLNLLGQRVKVIVNLQLEAGTHQVVWDGTDANGNRVASGVYLYRMNAGAFAETKKMVLLK